MKINDYAWNGLNRIAHKTKMDCWFSLMTIDKGTNDVIYDLDNQDILSMEEGLSQFADGITDPLSSYGLCEEEESAVRELFHNLEIPLTA